MIHSRILIVSITLHVLVLVQRLGTPINWSRSLSILLDIGCIVNFLSLLLSVTTFTLLALRSCRLMIAQAGFAICMGFISVLELCAFVLFLVYSLIDDSESNENDQTNGNMCAILSLLSVLFSSGVLPVFLAKAPPDVKSHRPETYENGI